MGSGYHTARIPRRRVAVLYGTSFLVFAALFIYNLRTGSQWYIDALLSLFLLTLVTQLRSWLHLRTTDYLLILGAILLHNLGSFGAYSLQYGLLGWDTLVHTYASFVSAIIIFNALARKLEVKPSMRFRLGMVRERSFIIIVLVIAFVAMLGVVIELAEFGGGVLLGSGDGLLFVGAGDDAPGSGGDQQYEDTMMDIIANLFGSVAGVGAYYLVSYRRKQHLRYGRRS